MCISRTFSRWSRTSSPARSTDPADGGSLAPGPSSTATPRPWPTGGTATARWPWTTMQQRHGASKAALVALRRSDGLHRETMVSCVCDRPCGNGREEFLGASPRPLGARGRGGGGAGSASGQPQKGVALSFDADELLGVGSGKGFGAGFGIAGSQPERDRSVRRLGPRRASVAVAPATCLREGPRSSRGNSSQTGDRKELLADLRALRDPDRCRVRDRRRRCGSAAAQATL